MATKAARTQAKAGGYRCSECGWTTIKWVGRCGECQAWGSVSEIGAVAVRTTAAPWSSTARPSRSATSTRAAPRPAAPGSASSTGCSAAAWCPGAVVLVAGEPGIGKSTLLLDVAARAAREGQTVLYVSGEESAAQVRMRAERIEAMAKSLYLASETDLATVLGQIEADPARPGDRRLGADHRQRRGRGLGRQRRPGPRGRRLASSRLAKSRGIAIMLVGHVTKDGSIAGPRVLEHLVDVVVQFEGDRHSRLRLVRAVKNRYGPTDEVGCFDLSDVGIVGLSDPSGLFLSSRDLIVPGTCVTVTLEGRRPLVTEVQALLAPSVIPTPRRTTSGLDGLARRDDPRRPRPARRRAGAPGRLYVSTVGGVRLTEPAADLAVALAMASSVADRAAAPGHHRDGRGGPRRRDPARSPASPAGWPRPRGWASAGPWSPLAPWVAARPRRACTSWRSPTSATRWG